MFSFPCTTRSASARFVLTVLVSTALYVAPYLPVTGGEPQFTGRQVSAYSTNEVEAVMTFNRGVEAESAGRFADALEAYRAAGRIMPTLKEAFLNLGSLLSRVSTTHVLE